MNIISVMAIACLMISMECVSSTKKATKKSTASSSSVTTPQTTNTQSSRATTNMQKTGSNSIEETIDKKVPEYPTTYTIINPKQNCVEFVATDPATQKSITGITSLSIHKKFHPVTSLAAKTFDQTRVAQWTTGASQKTTGYVESVKKIESNQWRILLVATPDQKGPGGINLTLPSTANTTLFSELKPKPIDEIRAEIRTKLVNTATQQGRR